MQMTLAPAIFKAYDIRGIVPDQLDAGGAYAIGRAAATQLHRGGAQAIVVGRDARRSSPELAEAIAQGVLDEGLNVYDVGLVSTPLLYFAIERLNAGGGLMITASHNPPEYNGVKVCREHAIPVGGESGLREIAALAARLPARPPSGKRGSRCTVNVLDEYVDHVLAVGEQRPKLRVVLDCANGMAGVALRPLLDRLPVEAQLLYPEPDGTFPNHEADPSKAENLRDLVSAVRRTNADLGVAFDGDADRAVFVDEHARPVPSDLVTALLARRILARSPGAVVLYDLRSSRATAEEITAAGGKPEMSRVGHAFIKAQMRERGAVFAGELSGHFYFRFSEQLYADDGLAAFVAMLDLLGSAGRPLSELLSPLRRYSPSGEISRRVDDADAVLRKVEAAHAEALDISHLDGLLVRHEGWWFNLRCSNTEPLLRLNLEASDEAQMVRERDRLLALIGGVEA